MLGIQLVASEVASQPSSTTSFAVWHVCATVRKKLRAERPSEAAVLPHRTTCADSQSIVWVQRGRELRLTRVRGVPLAVRNIRTANITVLNVLVIQQQAVTLNIDGTWATGQDRAPFNRWFGLLFQSVGSLAGRQAFLRNPRRIIAHHASQRNGLLPPTVPVVAHSHLEICG